MIGYDPGSSMHYQRHFIHHTTVNEMNDVDMKTCTVDSVPQELEAKMREKSDQPQPHSK